MANSSPSLCVLPWMHSHVQIDGTTKVCCVARHNNVSHGVVDSIRAQPVRELFGSAFMQQVRAQMLGGEWPATCGSCKGNEALGVPSFRQYHNEKYAQYFDRLQQNPPQLEPRIRSMDLRISNLCNFKCRMCGGNLSSRWSEDHDALHPGYRLAQGVQGIHDVSSFWTDFYDHIVPGLEEIHFAGGEPLITEQHYQILEHLQSVGRCDVELYYDTNLSRLGLKRWDLIALWKHFPNIRLSLSLDGTGALGEYIRHGLNYQEWLANVERVRTQLPHIRLAMHFVVNSYNVLDFQRHYEEIIALDIVEEGELSFTLLEWPACLNVQGLHPQLKQLAVQRLQAMLDGGNVRVRERPFVMGLIEHLHARDLYVAQATEFRRQTQMLDQRRGESILALVPELAIMLEASVGVGH